MTCCACVRVSMCCSVWCALHKECGRLLGTVTLSAAVNAICPSVSQRQYQTAQHAQSSITICETEHAVKQLLSMKHGFWLVCMLQVIFLVRHCKDLVCKYVQGDAALWCVLCTKQTIVCSLVQYSIASA